MKQLTTLFLFVIVTLTGLSQNNMGINTIPDSSAVLDISATDKGLLIPRMTEAEMNAIVTPATSLMVFNTTANAFWYWNGNGWTEFVSGTSLWTLSGTAIYVADTNYKVGIGTSNPSGKFEVATLNHTGTYGSDAANGGTATASEFFPGQTASLAFDNTPTTYWSSNNNLPAWIGYDLGAGNEKRIARYSVHYNTSVTADNSPNDWVFEASDDAVSWTVLDTQTGQGWTATETKTYTFSNTTIYRYYRLNISDNKGVANNLVSVFEMEIMEEVLANYPALLVSGANVGIGTSSPQANLDINGAVRIVDGNEANGKILVSDATGIATWTDGATVNGGGWTIDGNLLSSTFDSVGIGTTTPGAELEVVGHIWQTGTGKSVFLGEGAGANDDLSTNYNVAVGFNTLMANTTGYKNCAIGSEALISNTSGDNNIAIGTEALNSNTYGNLSIGIGNSALGSFIGGIGSEYNIAIGHLALSSLTTSNGSNIAIGYGALKNSTAGSSNISIGESSLLNNNGPSNIAVGKEALGSNTTGGRNVAIGEYALTYSSDKTGNVAIGHEAMRFSGYQANEPTSGIQNTAVGFESLWWSHTGSYNTSIGYVSLFYNESSKNTAVGDSALYNNTLGNQNTAIGYRTLHTNTDGGQNTALGVSAFSNGSSYSNSTGVGYDAEPGASNTIRLGNSTVTTIGGFANWTNVSDGRFKTNVQEKVVGLDFILKLRPVTYHLDMEAIAGFYHTPNSLRLTDSERLKGEEVQIGFIAQEVEAAADALGFDFHGVDIPKNKESHYGLRYAEFVVPLVKAVQELAAQNKQQQVAIDTLLKRIEILTQKLEKK